ncbi:hypothetical protein A4X13_0g8385 [Tilletia indica]|uniref:Protein kinase domain-containing protein n=1 Tax=Tilletia indica TaxID=43049 RepID=A0A8T8SF53_9BASI|nr:hypothetical protein A4X13_0g8385 [Tilletia indica]
MELLEVDNGYGTAKNRLSLQQGHLFGRTFHPLRPFPPVPCALATLADAASQLSEQQQQQQQQARTHDEAHPSERRQSITSAFTPARVSKRRRLSQLSQPSLSYVSPTPSLPDDSHTASATSASTSNQVSQQRHTPSIPGTATAPTVLPSDCDQAAVTAASEPAATDQASHQQLVSLQAAVTVQEPAASEPAAEPAATDQTPHQQLVSLQAEVTVQEPAASEPAAEPAATDQTPHQQLVSRQTAVTVQGPAPSNAAAVKAPASGPSKNQKTAESIARAAATSSASVKALIPAPAAMPHVRIALKDSPVGEGTQGSVYHGIDALHKRDVAVKITKCDQFGRPPTSVMREISALRGSVHGNVVYLTDILYDGIDVGLVIPFVPKDLRYIMNKKLTYINGLDLPTLRSYLRQILEGVRYLHEKRGIVHLDLKPDNKPDNILVGND